MQRKRFLATLLAVFLLLAQMTAALAEAPAPADLMPLMGREVRTSAGITYHENPLVDEATGATLKALLDSLKLSSRVTQLDEDEGYGEFALSFGEDEAASVRYVQDEDCLYIISALLPSPIAVKADDMPALMANLEAYLGESADVDMEALTSMTNVNFDLDALMASMDEETMASMAAGLEEWLATYLTAETYAEEPLETMLGADATSAVVYELGPSALEALVDVFMPMFTELDAYWTEYYGMISQVPGMTAELPPLDEFMQMVHSIPAQLEGQAIVPEDFVAYYAECMDQDGAPSVNIAHVYSPAAEDGTGEAEIYVEWRAAGDEAVISIYSEGTSIMLSLVMPAGTVTETADGQVAQTLFSAMLSIADGEEQFTLGLDAVKSITVKDNVTDTDVEVILSMGDGTDTLFDINVVACHTIVAEGDQDYTSHTVVDIGLGVEGEIIDLITLEQGTEVGEPQGKPFDPAGDIVFLHPAEMDQESFNTWMNEEVMMSLTQQLFHILSVMPPEVLAAFMPVEDVVMSEIVVAP